MSEAPQPSDASNAERPSASAERIPSFWGRHRTALAMGLLLLLGLAARFFLSLRDGHLPDIRTFTGWMRAAVEHGFSGFYDARPGANYPPLFLLILRGLGEALSVFGVSFSDAWLVRPLLRLPACIADASIALMLFVEAGRIWNRRVGLSAAALYFLNPVVLYNSAYWGQVDSIHAAFVLAAVIALNRRRPLWAGAWLGLGLLQKFQTIVFVPLIVFDIYRFRRWPGLGWTALGAGVVAIAVLAPFAASGALGDVIQGGYVTAVGKFNNLTVKAFNVWYLSDMPQAPSSSVPYYIVQAAAGDAVSVSASSPLLWLTYRRIGMALFAVATALTLSAYSRTCRVSARALAAGVLGLAFFVLPTEIHERYAFPIFAVLPLWAVTGPWKERAYWLLSVLAVLNLTLPQPVAQIGSDIGGLHLIVLLALLAGLALPRLGAVGAQPNAWPTVDPVADAEPPPAPSALVRWFKWASVAALAAACGVAIAVIVLHRSSRETASADVLYFDDLTPHHWTQAYGRLQMDRSVEGGAMQLGSRYFLRGVGTHADSTVIFNLPGGWHTFRALVGIDRHATGSARARVFLGDELVFETGTLTPGQEPIDVYIPLKGARRLKLATDDLGKNTGDHVNWALARLEREATTQ